MRLIPYSHQWIDNKDINSVIKVLRSDWITQGPTVKAFEIAISKYTGAKYAVAVSNGTAALHIACLAVGIEKGDEVITSPITFLASANCVIYCGGKPIFADVQEDTGNIKSEEINAKITKRTKMLIPVHYAGHPCDMEKIQQIAKRNKLFIIEDSAHALGAKYKGSKIGSCKYSDMTILSFHPVKHITAGEGGMVLTNRRDLYKKLLILRNHGITKEKYVNVPDGDWYYEMQLLGYNYRITDIQSALGISQLKRLAEFVRRRREIVQIYNREFKNSPYFNTPVEKTYAYSSYHLCPIRLKEQFMASKKEIFTKLREKGIGAQVHYIPVYLQPYYRKLGYKKGSCPQAEKFYRSEISIPVYPSMKNSDVNYVIKTLNKVLTEYK